jgi:hypothetical protein
MTGYAASSGDGGLPLENFIQAVQSQLDKAQTAMTLKARNLNMPLTFAIKDISLDLRAHVEFASSEIRIRPAGSADTEASMFHLVFAAITRPMIEENAVALSDNPDDRAIDDIGGDGDGLSEDDRRKLEWVGVRTVSQLRNLEAQGGAGTVQRVTGLPVSRLRAALERASTPFVEHITPVERPGGVDASEPPLLRLRGRNLLGGGGRPQVTLDGRAMALVSAHDNELLLAPQADQWAGELSVAPPAGPATTLAFDLSPYAPAAGSGEEETS